MPDHNLENRFNPLKWKRPAFTYRVNSFIVFGSLGVGKTTLYDKGWRELVDLGIYKESELRQLMPVEPTTEFSRLNIIRRKHGFRTMDSWIDGVGENFHKLAKELRAEHQEASLKSTIKAMGKCASGIVIVMPACLFKMKRELLKDKIKELENVADRYLKKAGPFRRDLKCKLLVTQASSVLPKSDPKLPSEFCDNIRHLMEKSSLDCYCSKALVVESIPDQQANICRLVYKKRKKSRLIPDSFIPDQLVLDNPSARFCSAGTALAWVMGILPTKDSANWGFVVTSNLSKD